MARAASSKPRRAGTKALGVLLLLTAAAVLFIEAGNFLVREDPVDRAEAALVLSGGDVLRPLAARDLYQAGRIKHIYVIPEPRGRAWEELVKLKIEDPDHPLSERILTASGVPRNKITFLPRSIDGTIGEAREVREFLRGKFPDTLVLITSKTASRRARFIFRQVLKHEPVTVLSSPSPYDGFEPARWWAQPRNALYVLMEYLKFAANAATLALSPAG